MKPQFKPLLFSAAWCTSCTSVKKHLDQHEAGKVEVVDMDTPQGGELAKKYNVRGLPTLVHKNSKNEVINTVGAGNIIAELGGGA